MVNDFDYLTYPTQPVFINSTGFEYMSDVDKWEDLESSFTDTDSNPANLLFSAFTNLYVLKVLRLLQWSGTTKY